MMLPAPPGFCRRPKWLALDHQGTLFAHDMIECCLKTPRVASLKISEAYGDSRATLHPLTDCCTPPPAFPSFSVDIQEQVMFCSELETT